MRRTGIVLLLFLLVSCLWACSGENGQAIVQPDPQGASPVAGEATPTNAPIAVPTPEPTPGFVAIQGQLFSADTETLAVPGTVEDSEPLREALSQLPNLHSVTVDRAVPEADIAGWDRGWAALTESFPAVSFTFRDYYRGTAAEAVETFAPSAVPDEADLAAVGRVFEHLTRLDLRALDVDGAQVAAMMQ